MIKNFFKVLERRNKIKQCLNYILMINQNILAILRIFSNLKKKNFKRRRQLSKLLLLNFFTKFLTERKYLTNNLTFVRQKCL